MIKLFADLIKCNKKSKVCGVWLNRENVTFVTIFGLEVVSFETAPEIYCSGLLFLAFRNLFSAKNCKALVPFLYA